MISVEDALNRLLALAAPLSSETVALEHAAGRVLARTVTARRDQPPFAAASMDGYAVRRADAQPQARLTVIGEAAAGRRFPDTLGAGQAVRIFTGAPVPEGADLVVIQENVQRSGAQITLVSAVDAAANIRPSGTDFAEGAALAAPRRLRPQDVALLAAMNAPSVAVTRKPDVALISTGNELVLPGDDPGADQIVASNTFGLHAMLDGWGAHPRLLPIARDTRPALRAAFDLARGADLIVTIGGASVGDHDLIGEVTAALGMERAFYKIAMRPGKPLMAGRLGEAVMIGLPGNPVSAMVCGHVFLAPVVARMLGLRDTRPMPLQAPLAAPVAANGPRAHYMRAVLGPDGLRACDRQDSSLLSVLAQANALLIRPPHDPARKTGDLVPYMAV